jgi:hypothetical protein
MHRWLVLFAGISGCSSDQDVRRLLRPPEVAIVAPTEGQELRQGQGPLPFAGTATDSFDGPNKLDAVWSVDGDELDARVQPDGTVPLDLDPEPLALGDHVLGLTVTDRDGMSGDAEVDWVLLGAISAPVVEITAPADGATFAPGDEIAFRGQATDNNTAPGDLQFRWVSSLDGIRPGAISGDGQTVLFDAGLSEGTHLVTLQATDIDGEVGSDTVTVIVATPVETTPSTDTTTTTTTTTPTTTVAEVGDLVFSEMLVNPVAVDDEVGEWVELYNTAGTPLDLDGYSFHDLGIDAYTLVGPIVVAPSDYVVLCASLDPLINGGVSCDGLFVRGTGGPGAMALGNSGDEVVLTRPDGVDIDQVVYDDTWFVAGVAKGLDPTKLDAANNDDETMWCEQTTVLAGAAEPGTPGLPNDPCL